MNVNNKKLVGVIIGLLLYGCASLATATEISGAGSAAAKAMYTKWAEGYGNGQTIKLNYQPIGPSLGIKQIKGQAADFFTSDVALSDTELRKENLLTFPSAVSGVVPIVNLPGIKAADLQLSGEVLADIFSRKITTWNAPAIVALNPRLSMPNLPISPLVDQENVGLTYNFTDYLSKVSPEWKVAFGKNVDIDWPNGVSPVKGSTALVTALKRTLGTIGYVDFSVVARDKLAYVQLKNHSGKFVSPGLDGFQGAVNNSGWRLTAAYDETLTNKGGPTTWPITTATFVIVPQTSKNPENTIAMLKFFSWAFIKGDQFVAGVSLPEYVQAKVFRDMLKITDSSGARLQWSAL